ncbi:MAG: HAD-IB family phosphatase [Planctomycetota bacterium]|nr:HAD-IB family phosphatase [Planctomycetota bacterium]MDA1114751.1 HAD-IB family phosphatase [Planctomycetota bacterium]
MSLSKGWPGAKIVFFDCDSTLAGIEGIDELAARCKVDVSALTRAAMSGEIPLDEVFRKRLELISPSKEDVDWVVDRYKATELASAKTVIHSLQDLGIPVHVISGGLLPAVAPFAEHLGIAKNAIHAVPFPLAENNLAEAIDTACAHPLARDGGKPEVITQVCAALGLDPKEAMLIGDGASDLEAASMLGLFVGFGGVVTRDRVRDEAPIFLPGPELAGVALLAAGSEGASKLEALHPDLFAAAQQQLDLVK